MTLMKTIYSVTPVSESGKLIHTLESRVKYNY